MLHLLQRPDDVPADAVRRILSFLDWRSICSCARVCSAWAAVTAENSTWQHQLVTEFFRPNYLALIVSKLAAGWPLSGNQGTVISAATRYPTAWLQSTQWLTEQNASKSVHPSASESTCADVTCTAIDAPAAHVQAVQGALLPAHTCNSSNSANVTLPPGICRHLFAAGLHHAAAQHQALLSRFHTAISQITGWRVVIKTRDNYKQTAQSPGAAQHQHLGTSNSDQAAAVACQDDSSSSGNTRCISGYPETLNLEAIESGGWACGCLHMQQQEQSCWVQFMLPRELKSNEQVAAAVRRGDVIVVLQGLGACGWFNAATAAPFFLPDNAMDVLHESHTTGFYVWDQALEEGQLEGDQLPGPFPWDLAPGDQQQWQQRLAQPEPVTHLQHVHGPEEGNVPMNVLEPDPPSIQLRMLVYLHYQQLLQVLPWALPQALPVKPLPILHTPLDLSRRLLAGPCAFWLQLDVCQLHGGFKVGSCVVPLTMCHWSRTGSYYRSVEDQLLVTVYEPSSTINSTTGAAQRSHEQGASLGSSSAFMQEAAASRLEAAPAGAVSFRHPMRDQGSCKQVFLGDKILHGAASEGSDGSLVLTAADAMQQLLTRDEVMVDFALFDVTGRLLVGRAGVEVWSREMDVHSSWWQHEDPELSQPVSSQAVLRRVARDIMYCDEFLHEAEWQGSVLTEEEQQTTGEHVSCPVQTLYFLPDEKRYCLNSAFSGLWGTFSLWDTWIRFTPEPTPKSSARKSPTVLFRTCWSVVHAMFHE